MSKAIWSKVLAFKSVDVLRGMAHSLPIIEHGGHR
jgi:hypothetical protein